MLGTIADRRGRKGRQYPLQALLAIAIAAMLAGANDLEAIFRWGRRLKPEALALFGLEKAPCHSQWFYFFRSLDADALAATLGAFALARRRARPPRHRRQDAEGQPATRYARRCTWSRPSPPELSVVVGDVVLEPDQNEITAALVLLKQLPLEGAIITGDAIFCQREICEDDHRRRRRLRLRRQGQPARAEGRHRRVVRRAFPPAIPRRKSPPSCRLTRRPRRRPSRRGTAASRRAASSRAPRSCRTSQWPGAAQVARIWRERRIGDKVSTEAAYIVTSLDAAEASPARLLALVRAHWGIENRLHHVRDVSMDEDRCRSRVGGRALACLRNLALATIRGRGLDVREARENFREDRAEAIAAVTGRIL